MSTALPWAEPVFLLYTNHLVKMLYVLTFAQRFNRVSLQ